MPNRLWPMYFEQIGGKWVKIDFPIISLYCVLDRNINRSYILRIDILLMFTIFCCIFVDIGTLSQNSRRVSIFPTIGGVFQIALFAYLVDIYSGYFFTTKYQNVKMTYTYSYKIYNIFQWVLFGLPRSRQFKVRVFLWTDVCC